MAKVYYNAAKYHSYAEIVELLQQWQAAFPQLATVYPIGKTYEQRDIYVIEITNRETGPADDKPAYYIDANFHAGEVTGSAVDLYTISYLLENYGTDPSVTTLLDNKAFYIIPRVSIDGAELYLHTPQMLRSSTRLYPYEDEQDGLHPEDINGDGVITQMRVPDPHGEWKVSEHDPRLMVRRAPDDFEGEFYRVYMEGRIKSFDGVEVKPAPPRYGLDINRNAPANWMNKPSSGPYPFSEPETRTVADFLLSKKNIAGAMSYHTSGGVHLRPPCTKSDDKLAGRDLEYFKAIWERGSEHTGYPQVGVFDGFTRDKQNPMGGIFMDWVYEHQGILCWSTELWNVAKQAGIEKTDLLSQLKKSAEELEADGLKLLQWNDRELNGEGFVPWTPFEHPDLGPVEIGGWKTKYVRQNPPEKFLEAECHNNAMFTLVHAHSLPRLGLRRLNVEEVGGGFYRVSAGVVNQGYLPTNGSDMATRLNVTKPVEATISGGGVTVPSGKDKVDLGHLPGWGEKKVEWLVQATPGTKALITVHSPRAGKAHAEVTLP